MLFKLRIFVSIFLVSLTLHLPAQVLEGSIMDAFHSISSNEMMQDVKELTSPKYGGRLSGSPGYFQAAKWVANELAKAGLKPGISDSSFFQFFPNSYSIIHNPGTLKLLKVKGGGSKTFRFPQDYYPGSNSASGKVSGELVYVGYGISAPELGYDDYQNMNVKGKILLMETGVPYNKNDSLQLQWEPYSYHRYKFKHAREQGAKGLLYISKIANPNTSFLSDFVYAHVSDSLAIEFFKGSGDEYLAVKNSIALNLHPNSMLLKKNIQISASSSHFENSQSCNVIGIIEGCDAILKKEAIIVGAHLDAVGSPGALFPGALDNASGSVDILAAAKAMAKSAVKPKRSVIFIFFGGEECGLYGSKTYTESPVWPKNQVICMLNLDMVGNGTGFFLANGTTYADIFSNFKTMNDQFIHRTLSSSVLKRNFGRPRTDGAIFEKDGYKVLHLYTTGSVKPVYYHHPLDNTEALTPEIMEDAAKLIYMGVLKIANDSTSIH